MPGRTFLFLAVGICLAAPGCSVLRPSNERDWTPEMAVLSTADIQGDAVTIHNIRNCNYHSTENFEVRHYDKKFDLAQLESVDFIVVPFAGQPALAHTFLSFGFADGEHVAISVEVRREKGEGYSAIKGLFNQYEIMYVVGDERDLIGLRANHRLDDVYVYRAQASRQQMQAVFLDMLERTNKLAAEPEFYHLITNNCTTNVAKHINRISPNRVPLDYRVLLPGYSDRLAYDLGLIAHDAPFEQKKREARVNWLAYVHRDSPQFSTLIRR